MISFRQIVTLSKLFSAFIWRVGREASGKQHIELLRQSQGGLLAC